MMRILLILILLSVYPINANAFLFGLDKVVGSLFTGGSKTHVDFSKKDTDLQDVKAGLNDNQMNLKELVKVNMALNNKMDKMIEVNADVQAKVTAVDNTMQAGRDLTITNDPKLLWKIIYGLLGIMALLIRSIFADRKVARIERNKRDEHIRNVQKSKDDWKDKFLKALAKMQGININGNGGTK